MAITPGIDFASAVPLAAVTTMFVYDESMTSMRVKWELVGGASGYMLKYQAINATVPTVEKEVRTGPRANAYSAFPYPLYEAHWQGPCQWFLTSRWQNARKAVLLLCCLGKCVQKKKKIRLLGPKKVMAKIRSCWVCDSCFPLNSWLRNEPNRIWVNAVCFWFLQGSCQK